MVNIMSKSIINILSLSLSLSQITTLNQTQTVTTALSLSRRFRPIKQEVIDDRPLSRDVTDSSVLINKFYENNATFFYAFEKKMERKYKDKINFSFGQILHCPDVRARIGAKTYQQNGLQRVAGTNFRLNPFSTKPEILVGTRPYFKDLGDDNYNKKIFIDRDAIIRIQKKNNDFLDSIEIVEMRRLKSVSDSEEETEASKVKVTDHSTKTKPGPLFSKEFKVADSEKKSGSSESLLDLVQESDDFDEIEDKLVSDGLSPESDDYARLSDSPTSPILEKVRELRKLNALFFDLDLNEINNEKQTEWFLRTQQLKIIENGDKIYGKDDTLSSSPELKAAKDTAVIKELKELKVPAAVIKELKELKVPEIDNTASNFIGSESEEESESHSEEESESEEEKAKKQLIDYGNEFVTLIHFYTFTVKISELIMDQIMLNEEANSTAPKMSTMNSFKFTRSTTNLQDRINHMIDDILNIQRVMKFAKRNYPKLVSNINNEYEKEDYYNYNHLEDLEIFSNPVYREIIDQKTDQFWKKVIKVLGPIEGITVSSDTRISGLARRR